MLQPIFIGLNRLFTVLHFIGREWEEDTFYRRLF